MPHENEDRAPERDGDAARGRFPRRIDALSRVFEFAAGWYATSGIPDEKRGVADFVLEELFTNSVKYNAQGAGDIEVSLHRDEGLLRLAVTDFDSGYFDPREAGEVQVDAPLSAREPGGLGIHLVKKFAKRIDYDYSDRRSTTTIYLELG